MKLLLALQTAIFCLSISAASAPAPTGRLVVFADKKEGDFKSDFSMKVGTLDDLQNLKKVDEQKGVHSCFIGSPQSIKPILDNMLVNANKEGTGEALKLKTFEKEKDSLRVEVISNDKNVSYLKLKIDPC